MEPAYSPYDFKASWPRLQHLRLFSVFVCDEFRIQKLGFHAAGVSIWQVFLQKSHKVPPLYRH